MNLLCLKSAVNVHQQHLSKKEEHDCQTLGWTGSNIGCMVHKESQPKPSQCYNMVKETNVPQIVTRRSDMLNEGCIS